MDPDQAPTFKVGYHMDLNVRSDLDLSGLSWVQTVCKSYQQTAKVAASKERVKSVVLFYLLVSSADNFCKQFGPRSGLTFCRA